MNDAALPSLILALLVSAGPALAQTKADDMKGMGIAAKPAANAPMVHKAVDTVQPVDAKAGVVTVTHEPIKTLNWPPLPESALAKRSVPGGDHAGMRGMPAGVDSCGDVMRGGR